MIEKEFLVKEEHSAREMGSGDLVVLSTPSLIAFLENAAKAVVLPNLKEGETTVGIEISIQHLKATAIGKTIKVTAQLIDEKKTIRVFKVDAYDGEDLIAIGEHKRAIVNADVFMKNV